MSDALNLHEWTSCQVYGHQRGENGCCTDCGEDLAQYDDESAVMKEGIFDMDEMVSVTTNKDKTYVALVSGALKRKKIENEVRSNDDGSQSVLVPVLRVVDALGVVDCAKKGWF